MNPDAITADVVHDALRAVRHGSPLDDSPLLHLGALRVRLRAAGRADSPEARQAELARHLDEVVWDRLGALRGVRSDGDGKQLTAEQELQELDEDFAADSAEREAWSMLYLRYFAASQLSVRQIADRVEASHRTLTRRTDRGYALLAEALRQRELVEAPAAQHNIPHPLTRFIGREREIGDVRALLARHRLVTLTGVGGIGKSRLAMELGRAVAGDYADGAWMVELGAVEDGAHVASAVAAVFEVKEQPRRALIDTLADFFEAKHLLLVLDNCEHLTEACGDLVQALLGRALDLQVLATSRERLRIQGECVWTVPPLSVPEIEFDGPPRPSALVHFDSVRLFTDRALTAMPGFELTVSNAPHVAEICSALDGIPLATELAASRVKVLSPNELAARLATPLEVLKDGRRPTRPQHETLRSTIEWSYTLLGEREQLLFQRLAVFRGGWTMDAAESVCAGDGIARDEILDVLQQLVDKSLVDVRRRGGGRRYRMLRTVDQFARGLLRRDEASAALRDRHLSFFVNLAEAAEANLKGADQRKWLALLGEDRENLSAALRWAVDSGNAELGLRLSGALAHYWELQGDFGEGRRWLAACLAVPGADDGSAARAKALSGAGALAEEQADYDAAETYHAESVAIRQAHDDTEGIAESLSNLGNVAILRGDLEASRTYHSEALSLRRELGDTWGVAVSLNNLGNIAEHQTDFAEARALYTESAEAMRALGDQWGLSVTLNNLGLVASEQGDYAAASAFTSESLAIAEALDDRQGVAYALHTLGEIARREGDFTGSRRHHAYSLRAACELGDRQGVAESVESFGLLAAAEGDAADAVTLLAGAEALRERLGVAETESEQLERDTVLADLRAALGEAAYEAAWRTGSARPEEVIVASLLDQAPHEPPMG